jgi:hypothetical protein
MCKTSAVRRLALSLVLASGLLCAGWVALRAAGAQPPLPDDLAAAIGATTPGQLVVGVAPGFAAADLQAMLASTGATLDDWLPNLGLARVRTPVGEELAIAESLHVQPAVEFIAPDRKLARIADVPLDPYWPQQWGMAQVAGPAAWDLAWGDPSVAIAILDTGVLQDHWDLQAQTWYNPGESGIDPATGRRTCDAIIAHNGLDDDGNGYSDDCRGWDFVAHDANPQDEHGHGTVVAGIASAATNNPGMTAPGSYEGVAGMGRQVQLLALRVLDSGGRGYAYDIAAAMDYAIAQGVRVINLSLTFPPTTPDSPDIDILRRAIDAAQAAGVAVVGASGNENYSVVDYPARLPGVLAVGASTRQDTRAYFSNYGARLDLVAPGEGIFSTLRTLGLHSYGYYGSTGSGTSFAAPHVAGTVALVRSLRPDLAQDAVYDLIRRTADDVGAPGFDTLTGWGRLNAHRAVSEAIVGLGATLVADHATVAAGGRTAVRLAITAPSGAVSGSGARVALATSLGSVEPITVTADEQGRATAVFAARPLMGVAHITATLGSVTATLPVTITSGRPAHIAVTAAPTVIAIRGQTVITATVFDEGGSPVPDGGVVSFATTLGAMVPVTATIRDGSASAMLIAGTSSGTATAQASLGSLTATIPVTIIGASEPFTLTLVLEPAELRVDGEPGRLTATLTDPLGLPVADGTVVEFTADHGNLSAPAAQTVSGQASVWLASGSVAGIASVTARAATAQGDLLVPILAGPASDVMLSADPVELIAGYNHVAHLRAVVQDRRGNPVSDGTAITFTVSLGRVTTATVHTAGGAAATDFSGERVAGMSAITATAESGSQGFAQVRIQPGAPAQVALETNPAQIIVGEGRSRLRATVQDAYGNAVANGWPVTFTTDLGELRPSDFAGVSLTFGGELAVPTLGGVAEVVLASGLRAGTAHVQAAISPDLREPGEVAIRPGPPALATLSARPARVAPGGQVALTATVRDQYGNTVGAGAVVDFRSSGGQLSATSAPVSDGVAAVRLVAPGAPGRLDLEALCGPTSAHASVDVLWATYLPLVRQ